MLHSWNGNVRWLKPFEGEWCYHSRHFLEVLLFLVHRVLELQGRNCKQSKGADTTMFSFCLFPLHLSWGLPTRSHFFIMKVILPPMNRSMKLYKMIFTKILWDIDPNHISWGKNFKTQCPKLSHKEIQILGLHLSHGQECQRAQKPDWALLIKGVNLSAFQICFYCLPPSTSLKWGCTKQFSAWRDTVGRRRGERKRIRMWFYTNSGEPKVE